MDKQKYYVVKKGFNTGIFNNWDDCKKQIDGFKNPVFRKFTTMETAQRFLEMNDDEQKTLYPKNNDDIKIKKIKNYKTDKYLDKFKQLINSNQYNIENNYHPKLWNTFNNEFYIFTDGSFRNINCENNSGIGVYFSLKGNNIKEIFSDMTNNQCELLSVDISFKIILKYINELVKYKQVINIVSDSEYTIKSCSQWIKKWKENNWKTANGTDVKNKNFICSIDNSMDQIRLYNSKLPDEFKIKVKFLHVKSHQIPDTNDKYRYFVWEGNLIADALAQNKL